MQMVDPSGRSSYQAAAAAVAAAAAAAAATAAAPHHAVKMEVPDADEEDDDEDDDADADADDGNLKDESSGYFRPEEEGDAASSADNDEPLNYKSWHPTRPSSASFDAKTSLTLQVGAIGRQSPPLSAPAKATENHLLVQSDPF